MESLIPVGANRTGIRNRCCTIGGARELNPASILFPPTGIATSETDYGSWGDFILADTAIWMPIYWGDYFGKTTSLSTEEHGAYLLLIGTYWQRGRALPDDDKFLSLTTKLSQKRWRVVRPKISEYFSISDGLWKHERVENEILRSSERLKSARANGRAGGLAKSKLITITTTNTQERKKESSLRSDSPNAKAPRPSKTMIPENCPTVDDQKLAIDYWLRKERPDLVDRLSDEVQAFRAHHRKDGSRMADWSAAWTTWYGNAVRFNKPPGQLFSQQPATWKPLKVGT